MLPWSRAEGWLLHFREVRARKDGLSVLIAMEISLRNRFSCHISARHCELTRSSQGAASQGGPGWSCSALHQAGRAHTAPAGSLHPQKPALSTSQPWDYGARLGGILGIPSSSCLGSAPPVLPIPGHSFPCPLPSHQPLLQDSKSNFAEFEAIRLQAEATEAIQLERPKTAK